ncbi:hypothetical protein NUW58_g5937 [Xylaria curta]|uniref:Uncharacterized protein n=1 Tax=Xylaria curta TaxID=42375 RepID=A0ACC1P0P6_9PEZI|nr:hypothetical protein NUW58_g5937 [Xylaria curta]
MDSFEYQPLDLKRSAFRLVHLLKGPRRAPVMCEIIHTTLDENAIPYEAVSYTWGVSFKPCTIRVQGRNFNITANLWNLLLDLRQVKTDRYLWIDAISINQADDNERTHQVQRMQDIYSSAERVLLYLGPITEDISIFMDFLTTLQRHVSGYRWGPSDERWQATWEIIKIRYDKETLSAQQRGLNELLNRQWFRRVWVLQEIASARTALLCCGTASVPVPIFFVGPMLLGVELSRHSRAIFSLMPTYLSRAPRKPLYGSLLSILSDFHESEASDPRDQIFALLGLCSEQRVWENIVPDYTMTESAVVRTTIAHLLTSMCCPPPRWIRWVPWSEIESVNAFLKVLRPRSYMLPHYLRPALAHNLSFWDVRAVQSFLSQKERGRTDLTPRMIEAVAANRFDAGEIKSRLSREGKIRNEELLWNCWLLDRLFQVLVFKDYPDLNKELLSTFRKRRPQPFDWGTNLPYAYHDNGVPVTNYPGFDVYESLFNTRKTQSMRLRSNAADSVCSSPHPLVRLFFLFPFTSWGHIEWLVSQLEDEVERKKVTLLYVWMVGAVTGDMEDIVRKVLRETNRSDASELEEPEEPEKIEEWTFNRLFHRV